MELQERRHTTEYPTASPAERTPLNGAGKRPALVRGNRRAVQSEICRLSRLAAGTLGQLRSVDPS
jgi:hypothetical protein